VWSALRHHAFDLMCKHLAVLALCPVTNKTSKNQITQEKISQWKLHQTPTALPGGHLGHPVVNRPEVEPSIVVLRFSHRHHFKTVAIEVVEQISDLRKYEDARCSAGSLPRRANLRWAV
jgi:hypothetical protein